MSPLEELVPLARDLGRVLLHFLWQGAAIAIALSFVLAFLRRRTPQARYAACCAALVVIVAAPLLTYVLVAAPGTETPAVAASATAPAASVTPASETSLFLPALALFWALGSLLVQLRLVVVWYRAQLLRRRSTRPVPARWQVQAHDMASRLGIRAKVLVVESALARVPATLGVLRPIVLIPTAALTGLTPDQLRLVLAHELAHVRRYDYAVNLVQAAVEALLFYHPAVWWLSHRLRIEREFCCDDLAVELCGDALGYARALERLDALRTDAPELALAFTGGSLMQRIQRLFGLTPQERPRLAMPALAALALAGTLSTSAFALSSPAVQDGARDDERLQEAIQDLEDRIQDLDARVRELRKMRDELHGEPRHERHTRRRRHDDDDAEMDADAIKRRIHEAMEESGNVWRLDGGDFQFEFKGGDHDAIKRRVHEALERQGNVWRSGDEDFKFEFKGGDHDAIERKVHEALERQGNVWRSGGEDFKFEFKGGDHDAIERKVHEALERHGNVWRSNDDDFQFEFKGGDHDAIKRKVHEALERHGDVLRFGDDDVVIDVGGHGNVHVDADEVKRKVHEAMERHGEGPHREKSGFRIKVDPDFDFDFDFDHEKRERHEEREHHEKREHHQDGEHHGDVRIEMKGLDSDVFERSGNVIRLRGGDDHVLEIDARIDGLEGLAELKRIDLEALGADHDVLVRKLHGLDEVKGNVIRLRGGRDRVLEIDARLDGLEGLAELKAIDLLELGRDHEVLLRKLHDLDGAKGGVIRLRGDGHTLEIDPIEIQEIRDGALRHLEELDLDEHQDALHEVHELLERAHHDEDSSTSSLDAVLDGQRVRLVVESTSADDELVLR